MAVATMPAAPGRRVWVLLLAVTGLLGVLWAAGLPQRWLGPEVEGEGVQRLLVAERQEAGDTYPTQPPDPGGWEARALPDNWNSSRPGRGGYVWYRLRFAGDPAASERATLDTLYRPALCMNAEVWLNGVSLGSPGRMTEPVTRHLLTPLLWHLSPDVLARRQATSATSAAPLNELRVLVVGYPHLRGGLGEVYVGPREPLSAARSLRAAWQTTGTIVSVVLSLLLGGYSLLLWSRDRRQPLAGLFGVAALVWGLRNLNLFVTEPWGHALIGNLLWSRLAAVGAVVFIGLLALLTLRYGELERAGWHPPRWQRPTIWAYLALSTAALLFIEDATVGRVAIATSAACGSLLTVATQARLTHWAWKSRKFETRLLALTGAVYLLLMLADTRIILDAESQGQMFLRQYAAVPLFLSIGWVVTRRYLDALSTAREHAGRLQTEVAAQATELRKNFDALRSAEREHAQAQERERLMRDLHDGLGLHLISALNLARAAGPGSALLQHTLQDALDDLRMTVDSLSDDERSPAAILGTLRYRLAPRLAAAGVDLAWRVDGDVPELPWLDSVHALSLLRIVQEAIANAVRHSGATQVTLSLACHGPWLDVAVDDNGLHGLSAEPGLDDGKPAAPAAEPRRSPGRGLLNMQARTRSLGGEVSLTTHAAGHRLLLRLPMVRIAA